MRKPLVLGTLALAVAGSALAAVPASAAAGDTTVTFTAGTTGSGVSILPSAAAAGVTVGNTVTATLTSVITDLRIAGGSWTSSVSSSNYTLVGATTPGTTGTVPAASAKIYNTSATVTVPGTATLTNTHVDNGSALTLSTTPQTLMSATTTNVNVTTVASTLVIDVTGKDTGAYTGTLNQTVV
jgi:hypothetical protein